MRFLKIKPGYISMLRWAVPVCLVLFVIFYEFGLARWLHNAYGFQYHALMDLLTYGTIGPILVFMLLDFINRWIQERETSDFQAELLANAKEKMQKSMDINDEAIQVLFSTSTLIESLKTNQTDLPFELAVQTEKVEQMTHQTIEKLRTHLLT